MLYSILTIRLAIQYTYYTACVLKIVMNDLNQCGVGH